MKFNKINIAAIVLVAAALVGCKNEDPSEVHYQNKLYISSPSFTDELLIKPTVASVSRELTLRVAQPADHEITASVVAAPELLTSYRAFYYDAAVELLPAGHYEIVNGETKVSAGSVSSTPVTINFLEINTLDRDIRYVLPVTVASVSGIDMLASGRTMYYLFKGAALINVVPDLTENRAWPVWKNAAPLSNMRTFTLEALVNFNVLNKQITAIMGIEGKFLVRMGDAGVPPDQLQVAASRNTTSSELKIATKRWTHIAVTFNAGEVEVYIDGEKKHTGNVGTSSVNFSVEHSEEDDNKPRCFWFGYAYNSERHLDGMISEARIWDRVLTTEEINAPAHFYQVEPTTPNLVSYWKFDEGAGTIVKDQTANGNDVTIGELPKWVTVSLPESKK